MIKQEITFRVVHRDGREELITREILNKTSLGLPEDVKILQVMVRDPMDEDTFLVMATAPSFAV